MNEREDEHEEQVFPREELPFVAPHLPGIGGEIKLKPEYFTVEEIPLYEAQGTGEHMYVSIARTNCNTKDLQQKLAYLFGLREMDIGFAGLKDRRAHVIQTFSLWLPSMDVETVSHKIEDSLQLKVLWARRHGNKLRTGHLQGNRFHIVLTQVMQDALAHAQVIADYLQEHGFPNYYGEQRFGRCGNNAELGHDILIGRKRYNPWLRRFLISAYQSFLYNEWVAERMKRGNFETLILGDIAKKTDTGGLFEVENVELELPRFLRREITYTGPIFGYRMYQAKAEAQKSEQEILYRVGVNLAMFNVAKIWGSRRPARIFAKNLKIATHPDGLEFNFDLPKGAYATTVLREFTKNKC